MCLGKRHLSGLQRAARVGRCARLQHRGGCRSAMAAKLSISGSAWRLREVPLRWLSNNRGRSGLFAPPGLSPAPQPGSC